MSRQRARLGAGLILALAAILAGPAGSALAASAAVTGNDGNPVALEPSPTIRHMAPEVTFTFANDELRYSASVTGPGGQNASSGTNCFSTGSSGPERIRYQGNGTYTVTLKVSKTQDDFNCAQTTTQTFSFVINAATAIPPGSPSLLMRDPDAFSLKVWEVAVDIVPGADSHEVRWARNATLGADGGIVGDSDQAGVSSSTGRASVTFDAPGTYTMVARASVFADGQERFTAWSAPVVIKVLAPFDLITPTFPDARGPSYKLSGTVRETSTKGKITISIAKGAKGKKFRRLGTAKIRKGGKFSLRFTVRKFGAYRLRYVYKGSATTAAGTVIQTVTIRRTFF